MGTNSEVPEALAAMASGTFLPASGSGIFAADVTICFCFVANIRRKACNKKNVKLLAKPLKDGDAKLKGLYRCGWQPAAEYGIALHKAGLFLYAHPREL